MRRRTPGRRPHGGPHSTTASEAPCQRCRRPVLYAWDEGRLVRAEAAPLDDLVATALRNVGRRVFVQTWSHHLIHETPERHGSLRLVVSRHAEHVCPGVPVSAPAVQTQLELFDHESVRPPAHRDGGQR